MAKGGTKFSNAKIAAALRKHDGLIPRAADELKTARQTIQGRIDRSQELQAVMAEIENDLHDECEGQILKAVKAGDMATARWYAERKMRNRGYGTKVETAVDAASVEKLAEAIGRGGLAAIRAIQAALSVS